MRSMSPCRLQSRLSDLKGSTREECLIFCGKCKFKEDFNLGTGTLCWRCQMTRAAKCGHLAASHTLDTIVCSSGEDSNLRQLDLQSSALPAELPKRADCGSQCNAFNQLVWALPRPRWFHLRPPPGPRYRSLVRKESHVFRLWFFWCACVLDLVNPEPALCTSRRVPRLCTARGPFPARSSTSCGTRREQDFSELRALTSHESRLA